MPFAPVDIARLEELRQASDTADVADESEPIAGGFMCYSGPGSWANQAAGLGLDGPVSDEDLDRLVEFYVSRGVEPRIEVCPFVDGSLTRGLERRRFVVREFENVLAREIGPHEDLRAAHPHGWPEGLEIVRADPADPEAVQSYVELSTSGFRPLDQPLDEGLFNITRRMLEHPRCEAYVASLDGNPAGAGAVACRDAVAALFGTSVLPEFRRRGLQAALILRRLERAREAGCQLAVIGSRPGISTERNAARVGFGVAYSKVVLVMPGEGLAASP